MIENYSYYSATSFGEDDVWRLWSPAAFSNSSSWLCKSADTYFVERIRDALSCPLDLTEFDELSLHAIISPKKGYLKTSKNRRFIFHKTMILPDEFYKLETLYFKWLSENGFEDRPANVMKFLSDEWLMDDLGVSLYFKEG